MYSTMFTGHFSPMSIPAEGLIIQNHHIKGSNVLHSIIFWYYVAIDQMERMFRHYCPSYMNLRRYYVNSDHPVDIVMRIDRTLH
jgi:hypothetical protein